MGEGRKSKAEASRREKKDWVAGYVFIAPVTIGLLIHSMYFRLSRTSGSVLMM